MKRSGAVLALIAALALVPAGLAARGSISTTATTVASGSSFLVHVCVGTDGDGGYLVVKGPDTFAQDLMFGPVTGCADVTVSTVDWVAGKYRLTGYEFTSKGTSGLGSVTVTVV